MFGNLFGSKKPQTPTVLMPKGKKVNLAKRFSSLTPTGQGSMSKVYKALDNQSGRYVCLKVQDLAKTAAALARGGGFDRLSEGEIATSIIHPNVVRTFDYGVSSQGEYFIVMEYIDGVSFNFVRQSRPLALADRLELLAQAADGLAAVHAAEFIHRDFGPKNLLVGRDDQVKLIDFGLAVPNTPLYQRPGNRTGTLAYMAPELVRREATNEKIDIFSFGVTAFEFLTGRMPYDASLSDAMAMMRSRMNATPIPIEQFAPKLPSELCTIINRTLAKKPADRWPSAASLGEALRDVSTVKA